jgi:hypothetical protein
LEGFRRYEGSVGPFTLMSYLGVGGVSRRPDEDRDGPSIKLKGRVVLMRFCRGFEEVFWRS